MAGCSPSADVSPTPTVDPIVQAGLTVFQSECAACHANVADTTIRGPSLVGIATRGGERVAGQSAEQYIYTSILRPDAYLVPDYQDAMPKDLGKKLTGEQIDSVVAYLLTLD